MVLIFPYSIGVSIESDRACFVLLKARFQSLRLIDQKILLLDPQKTIDEHVTAVNAALKELVRKHRIADPIVILGISRNLAVFRFIEFPVAVRENLRETLGYEIEKYLPFSESDIYFDFQVISEGKKDETIKVLLVAVKKEVLRPYFKVAEGIPGELAGIDIGSNALANFFAYHKTMYLPENIGVVYGRGDVMEFNLIRKHQLVYSKWITTGNLDSKFYDGLAGELKAMVEKFDAERNQQILQVVFCADDVSEERLRSLKETVFKNIIRINLSGLGVSDTDLVPAYGLALNGFQKAPWGMNLLPPALQKKPSKIGSYVLYVLVFLLVLSILGWGGSLFKKKRQAFNQLNSAIEDVKRELAALEGVASENQKIKEKLDYLNSFAPRDGRLIDIIKELSLRIPDKAWVSRFIFSDGKVKIEGLADNASELIPLLEASPYFSDASFLSTIRKGRQGKENFSIGLDVQGF